jgi:hypothetical protein
VAQGGQNWTPIGGQNWTPIDTVRGELYAKLLVALGSKVDGGQATNGEAPANVYPRTYDEIAPGHVVLVQASLAYGWWESIVEHRDGEMVTVRWRDYKEQAVRKADERTRQTPRMRADVCVGM